MRGRCYPLVALMTLAVAFSATAFVQPDNSPLQERSYRHADLYIPVSFLQGSDPAAPAELVAQLAGIRVARESAYLDQRTGRWVTLMPSDLVLLDGVAAGRPVSRAEAWDAFYGFIQDHQQALAIDAGELAGPGNVAVHEDGRLVQIFVPRVVDGLPVRDSYLTASLRLGGLVLFGARNWGDVEVSAQPTLSTGEARSIAEGHFSPFVTNDWGKSSLAFVPTVAGDGVAFRLAWVLHPRFAGEHANFEALVDAHSGELLAFEDKNHYATTRRVQGGVYPYSNDGLDSQGMEQPGWPMPFSDLENAGDTLYTDSGGNLLACVDGTVTTALSGLFVNMFDNCGPISESTAGQVLDLGTGAGDCVSGGTSPGNTPASRSGYYELNRIIEQAKAQLPANTWLQGQLTSNMNILDTCNAFWSGSTVNFFRSGGGCGNTGQLAGVFDHEWGHGMDDNDVVDFVSSPGEGIADIYAYLRLDKSCIGRGFLLSGGCNGYGDPCIGSPPCSGVRDIDWMNRASQQPHDIDFIDPVCGSGGDTPCGGSTHCEGAVYAEALFDLVNRDLPCFGIGWENVGGGQCVGAAAETKDHNTALEIATRVNYLGAGVVGNWFTCTTPFGGCNADGGYLNYLVADDDDMTLANGTPHMSAIFAAFDRHQIACDTPAVTDSDCSPPATAPVVMATEKDRGATLTWGAVVGASTYRIYRTDGLKSCDEGKILVGETSELTFNDEGLKNGRVYYYVVIPIGAAGSCFGPSSPCTPVTPAHGANLGLSPNPAVTILGGDGDSFLDNCEQLKLDLGIVNIGTGGQTGVTLLDVDCGAGVTILTPLPINLANLGACVEKTASVFAQVEGLTAGDSVHCEISFTSNEVNPKVITAPIWLTFPTEGDLTKFDDITFSFEADLEGWTVESGTFNQTTTGAGSGGGAPPTDAYLASSAFLPDQCDIVRSPVLSLQATTTLEVWTNFNIEPEAPPWYDRANIGIWDVAAGTRSLVEPSSGRLYNASGPEGTCGTTGQNGWADNMLSWDSSGFSAVDLGAAGIAGDLVQLDVRYGTDPGLHLDGFRFDEVRLTDVFVAGPDGQADVCVALGPIFMDGFESGDTSQWTSATP
ncbi:MAG: hypothetical protein V3T72_01055 [Thermoanaerobaculia bacterium]